MKNVYTVAQINSYIRNMFAQDFMLHSLSVKGEVSNCKYHSSGHIYFTLKDAKGTLSCVMFASSRQGLSFRLTEGMQVVVSGNVDVFERDGKYQIYAKGISLEGEGQLYEKFERLKRELEERGMFSADYKLPIPRFIKKLGVVTAPTGAAVQDIINIAARRNPYIQIILYPAIVQGNQAAQSIVNGIRALDQIGVDTIIIGRGGGSLEDLWAFNEEVVAQAIFNCKTPIISAVGHETDITISDFVSDLRAPTPSAAAELSIFEYATLTEKFTIYEQNMYKSYHRVLQRKKTKLENLQTRLQYLSPENQIKEKRTYVIKIEDQLQNAMEALLLRKRHMLDIYIQQLKGLSPIDKLNQGLSFVSDETGKSLVDINKVNIGDNIVVEMKNGSISAKVLSKVKIRR
ncbi:MAG TPA: exodeoxyribonuclease VII large subunit [Lachnospiraceae bacterium]|nr:exodeoxyribonuclease VII large subunit [Lachnospiraceae bacterium]